MYQSPSFFKRRFLLLLFLALITTLQSFSQTYELQVREGSIGGSLGGAVFKGDYTFLAVGLNLYTIDNTENDFIIAASTPLYEYSLYMSISGDYL